MQIKTDTDVLRSALIWAASGRGAFPDFGSIDQDQLYGALREHRLDGRMLDRLKGEEQAAPRQWLAALSERHMQTMMRVGSQIDLYAKIREQLRRADPSRELIALKGFELYAHSGSDRHIRYSDDIDVMAADPASVVAAVQELGPVDVIKKEHSYEYAVLITRPAGQIVEVHTRYNVTGFRPDADARDYSPTVLSGRREMRDRFDISSVRYPDLTDYLTTRLVRDTALPTLSPEAAVIIRCAHLYVGYLSHPYPLPFATVRLDELATVVDLAGLPSFNARRFDALCRKFCAQLVVGFTRRLAMDIFGIDPFAGHLAPLLDSEGPRAWFPHNLWWDGIGEGVPINLGWSPAEVVARSADSADVTQTLGRAEVRANPSGHTRLTMLRGDEDELPRYFFRRRAGSRFDVILELDVLPGALEVSASLPATQTDEMAAIAVSSGDWKYELFFKLREQLSEFNDESARREYGAECESKCVAGGSRYSLRMTLPWRALGRDAPPGRGEEIPILFKARQQDRGWGEIRGVVVAPMALAGHE
jgi:hypothetical protein